MADKKPAAKGTTVQFLIDTHFTGSSHETFSDFSPERVVEGLVKMGVDSVMFQAKCFRGYAYYDSKIAQRHPQLDRDIIGPLVRLSKQAGLEVFLYTCTAGDFYCWEHYPSMWMLDQNTASCGSGVVCTNGPYRDYYLAILLEMGKKFPLDGIFVDGPDPAFQAGTPGRPPAIAAPARNSGRNDSAAPCRRPSRRSPASSSWSSSTPIATISSSR